MLKYSINYKFLLTIVIILAIITVSILLYFKFINNNVLGKVKENFQSSPYLNYKWEIVKKKNNSDNSIQVSEFTLYDSNKNRIPINQSNVSNPNGNSPIGEESKNLVDNNTRTKWLDFNFEKNGNKSSVIFNMGGNSSLPVYYSWHTANDTSIYSGRNPISWRVYGSNDNNVWIKLSEINDYSVSNDNYKIIKLDTNDNNTNYFQLTYPISQVKVLLPDSVPMSQAKVLSPDFLASSVSDSKVTTTTPTTTPTTKPTLPNYSADNINQKVNETLSMLKQNDISSNLNEINDSLNNSQLLLERTQTRVLPSINKTSNTLNYPNDIIKTENINVINKTGELTPLLSRQQLEEANKETLDRFENITPAYKPTTPLAFNPSKSNNLNIPNNKLSSTPKPTLRMTRKDKNLFMNSYIPPKIDDFQKAEKDWTKEWDYNLKELKVSFPNIGKL
jgi:hypothetical protein